MRRSLIAGFVLLASALTSVAGEPVATAFASPAASSGSGARVTVQHWIGTWRGKISEQPPPPPGDPRNPYKVVVTIRSVSKRTIGTVRYPTWKCNYTLVKRSVTPGKLRFLMKVVNPGPFNCVNRETVVMRPKAKGASFKGTFASGIEAGSVSKAS